MKKDCQVYSNSFVNTFQENVMLKHKQGKALKDIVGEEYELHRKRVYEHLGLQPTKEKIEQTYEADIIIRNSNGEVVLIEECKGHYVDSCFLERAVIGFAKVVRLFLNNKKEVPYFIISSPTKYKKYEQKLEETLQILDPQICSILNKKIKYFTILNEDRIKRKGYFPNKKPYIITEAEEKNMVSEIDFIKNTFIEEEK